jgi:hypothetical protein
MSRQNKAYIIRSDGTQEQLKDRPTLSEAQQIVGGYIEIFKSTLQPNKLIICDEEGKLKHKLFNEIASQLYIHSAIVGDVIILEGWKTLRNG